MEKILHKRNSATHFVLTHDLSSSVTMLHTIALLLFASNREHFENAYLVDPKMFVTVD